MTGLIAEPQEGHFYRDAPQISDSNGKTWMLRGNNFLVAYSQVAPGSRFTRTQQVDEYCVVFPSDGGRITWNGTTVTVPGFSIAFVPPGDSEVDAVDGGEVVRIFSAQNTDLIAECANADAYSTPRTHIPSFEPWPEPPAGWSVRHYSLDVPPEEGRFGRIFRCTTLMVNVLPPYVGPRDPSKMSPHHHDDFEQVSLTLTGSFKHFLRWPWTSDMADWKDDQVIEMDTPSMLVIPPPVIHTTQATGPGDNLLIDIFGPPRRDFSEKPGWVLNADDYPMP
ncbi:MAG: hypothetical protein AAGB10_15295 [Pseudomonadota bacterium]